MVWDTLGCVQCPDCNSVLPIRLGLLTHDSKIALLTACGMCADKVTVRVFKPLDTRVAMEAAACGLPVVKYEKQS